MFQNDRNGIIEVIKDIFFWVSFISMFAVFILLFNDDLKVPKQEAVIKIDVKNKLNMCFADLEKESHE